MFMHSGPLWDNEKTIPLIRELAVVYFENWGIPRNPLAIQHFYEVLLPDLIRIITLNSDLLNNTTFIGIVAWKLRSHHPSMADSSAELAGKLLNCAGRISGAMQNIDIREPWKRIFRLWVSGDSLPTISDRTAYPLGYLDMLFSHFKHLSKTMDHSALSMSDCLLHPDFRHWDHNLLGFLCEFCFALTSQELHRDSLILEQVIHETGVNIDVSTLVFILEIIHRDEGLFDKYVLTKILRRDASEIFTVPEIEQQSYIAVLIDRLVQLHWVHINKLGKLTLSEKSAKTLAPFILPKLTANLLELVQKEESENALKLLLRQNPEVIIRIMDWVIGKIDPDNALYLLKGAYKCINRMVDQHIIKLVGKLPAGLPFIVECLNERESLYRALACHELARFGGEAEIPLLIKMLKDSTPGVRGQAAEALGKLNASEAVVELARLAEDYAEFLTVREKAVEALKRFRKE